MNQKKTDLSLSYDQHRAEIDAAIQGVLESGKYILGEEVRAFENEFSQYIGVAYGIGVASGSDALTLALQACGVGPGDQVIAPSFTSVATIVAIEMSGATPLFIDIDDSYTIDLNRLQDLLKSGTHKEIKVVLPVHLYGYTMDMHALIVLARRYGLSVVEDCAQAHGALREGVKAGAWGDIAGFSFYPTKNLGAFGDGGMVVTSDPYLAEKVQLLRQYGWKARQVSEIQGRNSRLDELQAAVLRVKLKYLDRENSGRIGTASAYDENLQGARVIRPALFQDGKHVYHQYVIRTERRAELIDRFKEQGIIIGIHYPVPVHLQPAYRNKYPCFGGLANSEKFAGEVLSLPVNPWMKLDNVINIVKSVSFE